MAMRRGPGGFQRRVALKLLLPPVSYDEDARKAFIAEARLMALFDHPNLMPVTDLGEDRESSVVYAVMPYLSGISLASIARDPSFEGLEVVESLYIVAHVLSALGVAHNLRDPRGRALGIIHRDVSPENVMIAFDGRVQLIDFGIALSAINPRTTRFHVVKGKLDYLSPEQASASLHIDQTTDIYSAGLLLYTLLTGRNPIDGPPDSALGRARAPQIPRLDQLVAVPTELVRVVHAMLSTSPSKRPQSATQTARALMSIMHRIEPLYDEALFVDQMSRRLAGAIEAERNLLSELGDGTQIIETLDGDKRAPRGVRDRRSQGTPIIDAGAVGARTALREGARKRQSGLEETRDDLSVILDEIEDFYED